MLSEEDDDDDDDDDDDELRRPTSIDLQHLSDDVAVLKTTVSHVLDDLAKVDTKDRTLTTEVCKLKDDLQLKGNVATITADVKLVQDNMGKLAAAITTLRSQQVIDQQNKPPAPPLRKRDQSSKTPAEPVGKGKKKTTATEQEASFDAAFEKPTEERMLACIEIFQRFACTKV